MGVVSSDRTGTITYTTDPETWTVNKYVLVYENGGVAVISAVAHSTLINNGDIHGQTVGVLFDTSSSAGTIINHATGHIRSNVGNGISFQGLTEILTNFGAVSGASDGMLCEGTSRNVTVNNKPGGVIFGASVGIHLTSDFDGGVINNAGLIAGSNSGVTTFTKNNLTTVLTNLATGAIQGGSGNAITTLLGKLFLDNHGRILGNIICNPNVDDRVINAGKITGEVHLGPGNDVFIGTHGSSGKIFGADGTDKLTGSLHKDFLSGGLGADTFFFKSLKDSVVGKHDVVTDFRHAQNDTLDVHGVDANTTSGGNQNFTFITNQGFHHKAGELHFVKHTGFITVQGDVNGDGKADFEIQLNGLTKIAHDDLHL